MHWWTPPQQRQRWNISRQIKPKDKWTHIFFDLFYVAGCINLGAILKDSASNYNKGDHATSFLYFCGTGLPVFSMWFEKLHYDARFTFAEEDIFHRWLDVLQICAVATALSRIRPPSILADDCQHKDMVQFASALWWNTSITMGRYLEVVWWARPEACDMPAAPVAARREVARGIFP